MKNLIITMSAVIFIFTSMGWQRQLNTAVWQQQMLQTAADEAAAAVVISLGDQGIIAQNADADQKAHVIAKKMVQMNLLVVHGGDKTELEVNVSIVEDDIQLSHVVVTVQYKGLQVEASRMCGIY
ncbi:hypothetical protein ACDL92_03045 [Ihubacter sp. mB4P-1]|uniref:hypothetical protein n=1 Tax=Ihubacter sp. mB4P-1 TaxID=3242370 RepID=UPI00137B0F07